jgi:hypothetical protein
MRRKAVVDDEVKDLDVKDLDVKDLDVKDLDGAMYFNLVFAETGPDVEGERVQESFLFGIAESHPLRKTLSDALGDFGSRLVLTDKDVGYYAGNDGVPVSQTAPDLTLPLSEEQISAYFPKHGDPEVGFSDLMGEAGKRLHSYYSGAVKTLDPLTLKGRIRGTIYVVNERYGASSH